MNKETVPLPLMMRGKNMPLLNRFAAWSHQLTCAVLLAAAASFAVVAPAAADLRLCNKTGSQVSVAIGYKDNRGWATEGWWNLEGNNCETLLAGTLISRFYYIYALDVDNGGEWGGKAYMCTRDKMFTIRGIEDCVARGYERTGFFEIDTGEQSSWTVQLTESSQQESGGL